MRFDYSAKNAAFVRQHGRCAKCGKYLNMICEDRRGHEGAWTAHDLVPLDEGGSNKAHNCVILCITDPDCHLSFAHGGHPRERVFLTPFAFPGWVFKSGGDQNTAEASPSQAQWVGQGRASSVSPYRAPLTEHGPWTASVGPAGVRDMSHPGLGPR
jgi:hypothetical protein